MYSNHSCLMMGHGIRIWAQKDIRSRSWPNIGDSYGTLMLWQQKLRSIHFFFQIGSGHTVIYDGGVFHHFKKITINQHINCTNYNHKCRFKQSFSFPETGNEEKLVGVRILQDFLHGLKETNNRTHSSFVVDENTPLTFNTDDYQECSEICADK